MILIVDMNWKKDSLAQYESVMPLVAVIKKLDKVIVKHYSELHSRDLVECNKIVLSGTTLKDTTALKETEKFYWIKDVEKTVLGIGTGLNMIGVVFGLRLIPCLEIGMIQITSIKDNPLFSSTFKAFSLHNFTVSPSEEFEVLAESSQCIQAIKHKHKAIYGISFCPEVRNEEILKSFINLKQQK